MLTTGTLIAERYEIIEKVGAGGMADVYKAKDQKLNRFIAIKIMKREFSEDTTFIEKFRKEAQSAAGFVHPNIVSIYDVGEEAGLYYIVMELVEGITLKTYIDLKKRIPIREAISIAVQVSMGLEAAHNSDIIHRDIKPQNIIISKDGKAKLADFGIARAIHNEASPDSAVMGSVHYTSPEQARGDISDEKSDIYSLGITIYEMLAGEVPFDGDTTVSVALRHIKEEPVSLQEKNEEVPEVLDNIVLKCIAKKPEDRYANMAELINDLKACLMSNAAETVKEEEEVEEIEPEIIIEEQDEPVATTLSRTLMILGIIAAIIIGGLAIYTGVTLYNSLRDGGKVSTEPTEVAFNKETQRVMIDLTGMTVEEATAKLNAMNLGIRQGGYDYSDEVDAGCIMAQSVDKGDVVNIHETIYITISNGPTFFAIPDVAGKTEEEARLALEGVGLVISEEEYQFDDSIDVGSAIATIPAMGTEARKGDKVTLIISRGKKRTDVSVPNLSGKTKEQAISALERAGLEVGTITVDPIGTSNMGMGCVLEQSPEAGKTVEEGMLVDLVLNKAEPTPAPTEKPTEKPKETKKPSETSSKKGQVTITLIDLPQDFESAYVTLKLTQEVDGQEKTEKIFNKRLNKDDFPLTVEVKGEKGVKKGTVTLFLDESQHDKTWTVNFD